MTEEERQQIEASNDELMRAYKLTFNSSSGQRVLLDLMAFGKFRQPIENKFDEGKRQVVVRIMNFSLLTPEQLIALYQTKPAIGAQGND